RAPVLTKSGSFLLTSRVIAIAQSRCDTYGVTESLRSACTNWVCVPAADTTEIGIDTPCRISAFLLLSTVIFGAEMRRTTPVSSSADNRKLRLKLPLTEPSERPIAPPSPVPVAAGKLIAKSDGTAVTPPRRVLASSLPPASEIVDGNTRPVALPVAALA